VPWEQPERKCTPDVLKVAEAIFCLIISYKEIYQNFHITTYFRITKMKVNLTQMSNKYFTLNLFSCSFSRRKTIFFIKMLRKAAAFLVRRVPARPGEAQPQTGARIRPRVGMTRLLARKNGSELIKVQALG
jgi:hypothetical protein